MEKLKCPKCGKMNAIHREYCWLCAYKLQNINHNLDYLDKDAVIESKKASYSNKMIIIFFIWIAFFFFGMMWIIDNEGLAMFLMISSSIICIPFMMYYQSKNKEIEDREKGVIYLNTYYANYISGIDNIVPNTECELKFSVDTGFSIIDKIMDKKYNLKYEKITNIGIMSENQIREYYQSAGGALSKIAIGGLLLGNVGMLLGATSANQIKRRENVEVNNYLVINYKKEENIQIIVFKIKSNIRTLKKVIKEIKIENKFIQDKVEEL